MAKNTPFSDITVLDFSRYLPGGYATQVLADLGATVIKVEDTGLGDFMRHDYPTKGGGNPLTTSPRSAATRSPFL